MFRNTTVWNAGFCPQKRGFASRTICWLVLYCLRRYGPLPADVPSRYFSAVSFLSAPTASVPPCARTTFEFTMPSAGFARIRVSAGFGTFERSTTVDAFGAETVTFASRNVPLTFRLIRRR